MKENDFLKLTVYLSFFGFYESMYMFQRNYSSYILEKIIKILEKKILDIIREEDIREDTNNITKIYLFRYYDTCMLKYIRIVMNLEFKVFVKSNHDSLYL